MKYIIVTILLLSSEIIFSQAIARQSINAIGGSHQLSRTHVEQSIGQPYQTQVSGNNSVALQPGFIQPRTFFVEYDSNRSIAVTISPNPASEGFSIRTDDQVTNASLIITDITGKIVQNEVIDDFRIHDVNCSTWQNGTYIITLVSDDGRKNNSRLIISK
jgi:hypothetical protein